MTRIMSNDSRRKAADDFCLERVHFWLRLSNSMNVIDLPINRNKSYVIEVMNIEYLMEGDDATQHRDVIRMLYFYRSGCEMELLCEY